jgi:hypothetical protein
MLVRTILSGCFLTVMQIGVAFAIEYNEPQPIQKFPGTGLLIDSGSDHGVEFKTFLENKRLMIAPDAIYYNGVERTETIEQGTSGKISWNIRARCAVRPDLASKLQIGLYSSSSIAPGEQFTEVDPKASAVPDNASRGWYSTWWAICKGSVRKF